LTQSSKGEKKNPLKIASAAHLQHPARMKSRWLIPATLFFAHTAAPLRAADAAPDVKLIPLPDRVRVEIGGRLFTAYIFGGGASRPYCYPVLASDGTPMTRNFPMKRVEGEDTDHAWQRSLWFAHSDVNGVDFWNEGHGDKGHSPAAKGKTVQDALVETKSGKVGEIRSHDRWVAPDGKVVCTDARTIRFQTSGDALMIDFEITLHAPTNGPLVLGDNKDGTMAMRVAQWMTLPHKYQGGGKSITGDTSDVLSASTTSHGHIVNSAGQRDNDCWGKRADWCDCHAEHDGKIYGVAIFDNPQNLRHPTWWMARDYGLFGANPFGRHDFENLPDQPHAGDYTIPAGGELTLRYRFYFHYGDEQTAKIAEHYADYANGK
jgi:Family of unknown function (DUF6807)